VTVSRDPAPTAQPEVNAMSCQREEPWLVLVNLLQPGHCPGPGQFEIAADLVTGTGRDRPARPIRGWQVKRSWSPSHLNHRVTGTLVR